MDLSASPTGRALIAEFLTDWDSEHLRLILDEAGAPSSDHGGKELPLQELRARVRRLLLALDRVEREAEVRVVVLALCAEWVRCA